MLCPLKILMIGNTRSKKCKRGERVISKYIKNTDTDFFSVLAAIIRESSDKQLVLRIVKALPFIHQPDRVAPKASDV